MLGMSYSFRHTFVMHTKYEYLIINWLETGNANGVRRHAAGMCCSDRNVCGSHLCVRLLVVLIKMPCVNICTIFSVHLLLFSCG